MKAKKERKALEEVNNKIELSLERVKEIQRKQEDIKEEISNQFKMYHLLEESAYTYDDAILQYRIIIELADRYIDDNSEFSKTIQQVKNQLNMLEKGKRGEIETFQSMELLGPKVKIIKNARFLYDGVDVEQDLIVIASTGIFAIEVKNWKNDATLTSAGILQSNVNSSRKIDVITQIRRHRHCLERMINESSYIMNEIGRTFTVHPIILWQNKDSSLKDKFQKVPICCVNDLEYEIGNTKKYPETLTKNEVDLLYEFIKGKQIPPRKYPLNIDDDFYESFINSAVSIYMPEILDETDKQKSLIIEKEKWETIIDEKENHLVKYSVKKVGRDLWGVAKIAGEIIEAVAERV